MDDVKESMINNYFMWKLNIMFQHKSLSPYTLVAFDVEVVLMMMMLLSFFCFWNNVGVETVCFNIYMLNKLTLSMCCFE